MRRLKIHRTTVLAAAIAMVLCVRAASAGIVVSPLKQEISVKPGRTAKFYITISNHARSKWEKAQSVRLEVMDFSVSKKGGLVFAPAGTVKNSASKWIKLGKSDLTLAPGKGQKVACTIKAPYSAVGEYYSAVMVTMKTKAKTKGGLMVEYRIASGVFVTVAGRTFPKQAKIVHCEVVWPKPPESLADEPKDELVKVLAVLKNTGRARFVASGELRISNARGRIVYRAPVTTKRARILPGDTRLFEAALEEALPPGQYTVKVQLDYQSKWAKARKRLPLAISADQAKLLAEMVNRAKLAGTDKTSGPTIEVEPKKPTAKIPPGGFRSLKVVVRNTDKDVAQCTAAVSGDGDTPIPASWITLQPAEFTLGAGRSRAMSLIVRVPSAAAGLYRGTLIIETVGTNGRKSRRKIPLALIIGAEK